MSEFSNVISKIEYLNPYFRSKALEVLEEYNRQADGIGADKLYIFETVRLPQRQAHMVNIKASKAGPWESYHQYGLALDVAGGGPGKWHWESSVDWALFGDIAKRWELSWGGDWGWDYGHIELSTVTIKDIQNIEESHGVFGVWERLRKELSITSE